MGADITHLGGARALVGLCGDPFALLPGGDASALSYLGWLHARSAQGLPGVTGFYLLICDGRQAQGRLRGVEKVVGGAKLFGGGAGPPQNSLHWPILWSS